MTEYFIQGILYRGRPTNIPPKDTHHGFENYYTQYIKNNTKRTHVYNPNRRCYSSATQDKQISKQTKPKQSKNICSIQRNDNRVDATNKKYRTRVIGTVVTLHVSVYIHRAYTYNNHKRHYFFTNWLKFPVNVSLTCRCDF